MPCSHFFTKLRKVSIVLTPVRYLLNKQNELFQSMVRLHYAIHGMILVFIGLYITLFTGVYGAPLNAKSSINKTLDISTTQPSYDEYGVSDIMNYA